MLNALSCTVATHGLGWCLLTVAKTLPGSILRCVGRDGTVLQAIFWLSEVTSAELATEDKGKASVLTKAPGVLLLPGPSILPGTEYLLDSALWLPHGTLEVSWPKVKRMNTQVAGFVTTPRLGSALPQVQVLLPASGK